MVLDVVLYAHRAAVVLLALVAVHRAWLVYAWWRAPVPVRPPDPDSWPAVTVQLPVFNERFVVERLVASVGRLDYPRDRLLVQVLDDSTDDTLDLSRAAVMRLRAAGIAAVVQHRTDRSGFKAGALAAGLRSSDTPLLAIFDADFVPDADFLRRLVPWFADPGVGMVQARWGHRNADQSWLTAAQALLLDGHFAIEHAARHRTGRWFNFNGTAGIWRRQAIEDAGGWRADTLTEDLDLSYRAQLAGWRFVYDDDTVAPAELPSTMAAFKAQQHRWAKGSVQTARKLLHVIWRAPVALTTRIEATFHLGANFAYPLIVTMCVTLPVAGWARADGRGWAVDLVLLAVGTLSIAAFYAAAIAATGGRWRRLAHVPVAMALGAGLSINQLRAVLEGLGGRVGTFVRTPKCGDDDRVGYVVRVHGAVLIEVVLAVWLVAAGTWLAARPILAPLPFLALFALGFTSVAASSLADARAQGAS